MRAGRCEARELAAVRALAVPTQHDLVAGRDHVIDGDPHIGESRAIQAYRALEHLGSAERTKLSRLGRIVVDRLRCDQLVGQLKLAVVEALLKQLA